MDSTNIKLVPCSILNFLSVQLLKHLNEIPSFCPNFQASQLLINSHKIKHEVARNILLILYIFNVFSMTQ